MFDLHPEARGGFPHENFEQRLLQADWEDALGPLRLNGELRPEELGGSRFYHHARVLLKALLKETGTKATPAGNLNREFVSRVYREMLLFWANPDLAKLDLGRNEKFFRDLHLVRLLSEGAGLVRREVGRFELTAQGRSLMGEESEGTLFRQLFITFFRRFDWRCHPVGDHVVEVQRTAAVSLWRLAMRSPTGASVNDLVATVLTPDALKAVKGTDKQAWKWGFTLIWNLFQPLVDFGLVRLDEPEDGPRSMDDHIVRLTSLWPRFIRFAPFH
jgi:hypothetical protein